MEEKKIEKLDLRIPDPDRDAEEKRTAELLYRMNNVMPLSEEYMSLMRELFKGGIGEKSVVHPPIYLNFAENVHIGNDTIIMPYFKCMSAGNIIIEDGVRIALNVTILTNNHDLSDKDVQILKEVHIGKNAWIGAGAIILPGVDIGENAVVGAGSVVTHDVPPYSVAAGNPAKVIKTLDGN